jgi:hypothetical protein
MCLGTTVATAAAAAARPKKVLRLVKVLLLG